MRVHSERFHCRHMSECVCLCESRFVYRHMSGSDLHKCPVKRCPCFSIDFMCQCSMTAKLTLSKLTLFLQAKLVCAWLKVCARPETVDFDEILFFHRLLRKTTSVCISEWWGTGLRSWPSSWGWGGRTSSSPGNCQGECLALDPFQLRPL